MPVESASATTRSHDIQTLASSIVSTIRITPGKRERDPVTTTDDSKRRRGSTADSAATAPPAVAADVETDPDDAAVISDLVRL